MKISVPRGLPAWRRAPARLRSKGQAMYLVLEKTAMEVLRVVRRGLTSSICLLTCNGNRGQLKSFAESFAGLNWVERGGVRGGAVLDASRGADESKDIPWRFGMNLTTRNFSALYLGFYAY
jgi:hypothetical protein